MTLQNFRTSDSGINLIKRFEGLRLTAYRCSAGVWTIGWGHTKTARPNMQIDNRRAESLLREDLVSFETFNKRVVTVPTVQYQFDALVSFAFNVGNGALQKSTLLRLLNQKQYTEAADQFLRWNRAGGKVLQGLVIRREAERQLFLTGAVSRSIDITREMYDEMNGVELDDPDA